VFYVKQKISDECSITIDIIDENVFTRCPDCGTEAQVDLVDVIENGGGLYDTAIFFTECSKKHEKKKQLKKRRNSLINCARVKELLMKSAQNTDYLQLNAAIYW